MTVTSNHITITEKAAREVISVMEKNGIPPGHRLRIGITGGGCSGLFYALGFDDTLNDSDISLEEKGIQIVLDKRSLLYISGTELDFADELNGRGFIFRNPNATKSCGCGNSFDV